MRAILGVRGLLTNWKVRNFKSLRDVSLSLTPITVFAGANSSGKSTLIQSILLIKQTLQYAAASRAIALNGPIVKLGGFDDVKNLSSSDDYIGIGWSLDVAPRNRRRGRFIQPWGRPSVAAVEYLCEWDVHQSADGSGSGRVQSDELRKLQPKLRRTELRAARTDSDRKPAELIIQRNAPVQSAPSQTSEQTDFMPSVRQDFHVEDTDDASRRELYQGRAEASLSGVLVSHFLPASIGVSFDAARQRARQLAEALCGEPGPFDEAEDFEGDVIPLVAVELLSQWLSENGFPEDTMLTDGLDVDEDDQASVPEVIERFRYGKSELVRAHQETTASQFDLTDLRFRLTEAIWNVSDKEHQVEFSAVRAVSESNDHVRNYFMEMVKYLGPLRDEPKHVYPLEALANPSDIGYRGEHTAAVLELNGDRSVSYVPSSFFSSPPSMWNKRRTTSLKSAVIDWLNYVGVAKEVITRDSGVFGHQLQVRTDTNTTYHDLTNVGVGVSQVLPIIVGALLSQEGSCLIYEQPELHLHPKVQARLADFFMAMSMLNKQCILETHSEYMVDRLRLRIAQSSDDSVRLGISLYFTSMHEGNTVVKPVEISRYGAVLDWPEDFFDQSQKEIEQIVLAAAAKRKSERRDAESN